MLLDVANGETQAVGERCIEAGAFRGTLHDEGIHVPVFGLVQGVWPLGIEREGEILAETPTVGRTVVIDDTDLIVTETIDAVFAQKELRVLNEEITDLRLGEIEDEAAGVSLVAEVQRVSMATLRRLAVEEVEAFITEVAACVIEDEIEQDGEAMDVTEIDQRLELIHLTSQIHDVIAAKPLRVEQRVHLGNIRSELGVLDTQIHFG